MRVGASVAAKGWASLTRGQPLVETEVTYKDQLDSEEVVIKVTVSSTVKRRCDELLTTSPSCPQHNGLCHTDLHMRDDDWGASSFPLFPGHEVVGTITEVGAGVPADRIGERVGVGWICNACRRCAACLRGEENICRCGYKGLIVGPDAKGGFAGTIRVSGDFCYTIPDALSSEAAAPLLCAGITVYQPIRKWVSPGSRVAVVGVGGLGHLALQFADAVGGVVTAIDMDASKAEEARGFGARAFVHLPEFQGEPNKFEGTFDVLINCTPVLLNTEAMLRALAPDSTLVQVGIPAHNPVMQVPLLPLVFFQKRVVGSIVGGRTIMTEMLALAAAKGIKPMTELMPLRSVNEAMAKVQRGEARYRVVLLSDEEWAKVGKKQ